MLSYHEAGEPFDGASREPSTDRNVRAKNRTCYYYLQLLKLLRARSNAALPAYHAATLAPTRNNVCHRGRRRMTRLKYHLISRRARQPGLDIIQPLPFQLPFAYPSITILPLLKASHMDRE